MRNRIFKISLVLVAFTFFVSATAFAQSIITGTVYELFGTDEEPMAGVNITVVNEQNRTLTGGITDMNGNYSIKMPAGDKLTLVYSFIGVHTAGINGITKSCVS